MSTKRVLTIVLVASFVLLAVGVGPRVANTARALPPAKAGASTQAGVTIPYPGSLTDETGQPVTDGAYDFVFTLYEAESGGESLWTEAQAGVAVQNGTFTALLGNVTPLPKEILGGAHWLEVAVRGPEEAEFTPLSPRQELSAAAPASPASPSNGLACPHDHFGEIWTGNSIEAGLIVDNGNTTSGDGIRGYTSAPGVNTAGLFGVNDNADAGGPGTYGYSTKQAGVYGKGGSDSPLTYPLGGGSGVYGVGPTGVYGYAAGTGAGDGVVGTTTASGMSGVYGYATNSYGVTGRSTNSYAVQGISENSAGVYGEDAGANPDDSYAVYANGDIYADDDLVVADHLTVWGTSTFVGAKTGYVVDVAQNDDSVSLHTGDVVVISGAGPALLGEIPVIKVRLAKEGETGAVIGVVDQRYVPAPTIVQTDAYGEMKAEAVFDNAAIAPGEYLTVVTLGSFKGIKVDASYEAIAPGDLLVASPNPGYAMRAIDPAPGTIIGKALGALESGTGVIPVVVTLQ